MKIKIKLLVILTPLFVSLLISLSIAQTPFKRMDHNKDGRLSKIEFKGPSPVFLRMDRNNDGYVTFDEASGNRKLIGDKAFTGKFQEKSPEKTNSSESFYVDTHNHLVSKKVNGKYNFDKPARIALEAMNVTGIRLNLLMPMPQADNQKLRLCFEDFLPVVEKYPQRFAALGGGGSLNVIIMKAAREGRVTAAMEKEFDKRALELVNKGAAGFGEMAAEHFSMSREHPYESVTPDHPLFLRLADLAAKYQLPIDIHMEAVPEKMPMPGRFKSPPNPEMLKPNIEGFSRLLAHNRKAKIIWVHLGWDNTEKRTVELTRTLLSENSNLYMSIRIASGMVERKVEKPTFPLDSSGMLKQEWLTLFLEFPDRFLIGSDEIIKPGDDHPSAGSIRTTAGLLAQLPRSLQIRIGYENAYRIYRLQHK